MEPFEIIATVSITLSALGALCKLTPTPKDDAIIAKAMKWFNMWPKPPAK